MDCEPGPSTCDDTTSEHYDCLGTPPHGQSGIFRDDEFVRGFEELKSNVSDSLKRTLEGIFGDSYDLDTVVGRVYPIDSSLCGDDEEDHSGGESDGRDGDWEDSGRRSDPNEFPTGERSRFVEFDNTILDLIKTLCSIEESDESDIETEHTEARSNRSSSVDSVAFESKNDQESISSTFEEENSKIKKETNSYSKDAFLKGIIPEETTAKSLDVDYRVFSHEQSFRANSLHQSANLGLEKINENHEKDLQSDNVQGEENDFESPESPPPCERQSDQSLLVCREIPTVNLKEIEDSYLKSYTPNTSYVGLPTESNSVHGLYERRNYTPVSSNTGNISRPNFLADYNYSTYSDMVMPERLPVNNFVPQFTAPLCPERTAPSMQQMQSSTNVWLAPPNNFYRGFLGENREDNDGSKQGERSEFSYESIAMPENNLDPILSNTSTQRYNGSQPSFNNSLLPNIGISQHTWHQPVSTDQWSSPNVTTDNTVEKVHPPLTPVITGVWLSETEKVVASCQKNTIIKSEMGDETKCNIMLEQTVKSNSNNSPFHYAPMTPPPPEMKAKDVTVSKQADKKTINKELIDGLQNNSLFKEILNTIKDIDTFKNILSNKDKLNNMNKNSCDSQLKSSNSTLPHNHGENLLANERVPENKACSLKKACEFLKGEITESVPMPRSLKETKGVKLSGREFSADKKDPDRIGHNKSIGISNEKEKIYKHFKELDRNVKEHIKEKQNQRSQSPLVVNRQHKIKCTDDRKNEKSKSDNKFIVKKNRLKDILEHNFLSNQSINSCKIEIKHKKQRFCDTVEKNSVLNVKMSSDSTIWQDSVDVKFNHPESRKMHLHSKKSKKSKKSRSQGPLEKLKSSIQKELSKLDNESKINHKKITSKSKRSHNMYEPSNSKIVPLENHLIKNSIKSNDSDFGRLNKLSTSKENTSIPSLEMENAKYRIPINLENVEEISDSEFNSDGSSGRESYEKEITKPPQVKNNHQLKDSNRNIAQFQTENVVQDSNSPLNTSKNTSVSVCSKESPREKDGTSHLGDRFKDEEKIKSIIKEEDSIVGKSGCEGNISEKVRKSDLTRFNDNLEKISDCDSNDEIRPPGTESWGDDLESPLEEKEVKIQLSPDSNIKLTKELNEIENISNSLENSSEKNSVPDLKRRNISGSDIHEDRFYKLHTEKEKVRSLSKEKIRRVKRYDHYERSSQGYVKKGGLRNKSRDISTSPGRIDRYKSRYRERNQSPSGDLSSKYRNNKRERRVSPHDIKKFNYFKVKERSISPLERSSKNKIKEQMSPVKELSFHKKTFKTRSPNPKERSESSLKIKVMLRSERSKSRERSTSNRIYGRKSPLSSRQNSSSKFRRSSPTSKVRIRSRSPNSKVRIRSRSPNSKVRIRSRSPTNKVRIGSRSPADKMRKRLRSPMSRVRMTSRSPINEMQTRSRSPVDKIHLKSLTPLRKTRSRSISPVNKSKLKPVSPNIKSTVESGLPLICYNLPSSEANQQTVPYNSEPRQQSMPYSSESISSYPVGWAPPVINNNMGFGYNPCLPTVPCWDTATKIWPNPYHIGATPVEQAYQHPPFYSGLQHYYYS